MADMIATIGRPPVEVHFGENTAEAMRQAALAESAATAGGNALSAGNTAALAGDTSVWDFYCFIITTSGCKMYRPRVTMTPVTGVASITSLGASNLNNQFGIGTAGTAITWSESEVMAVDVFAADLSVGGGVATQYAARAAYASAIGIELGVST